MKPEFKYGLFTGAILCLWIVAESALGLHTTHVTWGEYAGYLSNLVPLVSLFFLLRMKQRASRWPLSLGEGIGSGLLASFVGAMVVYIFMVSYNQWLNPEWIENLLTAKVAALRAKGVAEADIRRTITFYREANTPIGLVTTTLVGLTVTGGLYSLVLTFIVRRRDAPLN